MALQRCGDHSSAILSIKAAWEGDGYDPWIAWLVMLYSEESPEGLIAARAVLESAFSTDAQRETALGHLYKRGVDLFISGRRLGQTICGEVFWNVPGIPALEWTDNDGPKCIELLLDMRNNSTWSTVRFQLAAPLTTTGVMTATLPDFRSERLTFFAVDHPQLNWPRHHDSGAAPINVVIPVYKDYDATQKCLVSLSQQHTRRSLNVIIVDDDSPDREVAALALKCCEEFGWSYIKNTSNLGFAGSINKAILACSAGDVLLLNSDVMLSTNAVQRLVDAAYGSPRIGTVTPFSNDSASTSFPQPQFGTPIPAEDVQKRIDDVAWALHGSRVIDVLTNIGFCLMITAECLSAVGLLSGAYGPGYFEDVEFCLKASELGYRNVAAIGIYVGHAGSRSFGPAKSLLISRNRAVIESRFPGFNERYAVALLADPLRAARASIEMRLPPQYPVHLMVGRPTKMGPIMERRSEIASKFGGSVLWLSWKAARDGAVLYVGAVDGGIPQSLSFTLDAAGTAEFASYLRRLHLTAIEFCEFSDIPPEALKLLLSLEASKIALVVGSQSLAREALALQASLGMSAGRIDIASQDETTADWGDPNALIAYIVKASGKSIDIVSTDPMAQAYMARRLKAATSPKAEEDCQPVFRQTFQRVGILVPLPKPAIDRTVVKLAHALKRRTSTHLMILGGCIDDLALMRSGNVFVSGPIKTNAYLQAIHQYSLDALFFPYRICFFEWFSDICQSLTMPRAFFDWSDGIVHRNTRDLALASDVSSDRLCAEFVSWCVGGLPGLLEMTIG